MDVRNIYGADKTDRTFGLSRYSTAEWIGLSPDVDHENLMKEYIIDERGFVFMYVSNSSALEVREGFSRTKVPLQNR